jgi:hypothetical protein
MLRQEYFDSILAIFSLVHNSLAFDKTFGPICVGIGIPSFVNLKKIYLIIILNLNTIAPKNLPTNQNLK